MRLTTGRAISSNFVGIAKQLPQGQEKRDIERLVADKELATRRGAKSTCQWEELGSTTCRCSRSWVNSPATQLEATTSRKWISSACSRIDPRGIAAELGKALSTVRWVLGHGPAAGGS